MASVENNQNYTYSMSVGSASIQCSSNYKKDLKNLDALLECLNPPEMSNAGFLGGVSRKVQEGRVLLVRLTNYVKTGTWMNEAGARKLVKHFAKQPNSSKAPSDIEKMQQIYDRLAQVKRGEGTYVDGIDRQSLALQNELTIAKTIAFTAEVFAQWMKDPAVQKAACELASLATGVLAAALHAYCSDVVGRTAASAVKQLNATYQAKHAQEFIV